MTMTEPAAWVPGDTKSKDLLADFDPPTLAELSKHANYVGLFKAYFTVNQPDWLPIIDQHLENIGQRGHGWEMSVSALEPAWTNFTQAAAAEQAKMLPPWAEAYAQWFPIRSTCHTYAGKTLQHFRVLVDDAGWKEGDALLDTLGQYIMAELSGSSEVKRVGEASVTTPSRASREALRKGLDAYLRSAVDLSQSITQVGGEAWQWLEGEAEKQQTENFGAFYPDCATGLVVGKECVFLVTQILMALGPVTLGISTGLAPVVATAYSGIEKLVVASKVKTDVETVKKLIGTTMSTDQAWKERGEEVKEKAEKLKEAGEKGISHLKEFAQGHHLESVAAGAEVAEGALSGIGVVLSAFGFYFDIQKYETNRTVINAVSDDTKKTLETAAQYVFDLQSNLFQPQEVEFVGLVQDDLGTGLKMRLGGREGVLYSWGGFIPSDPKFRFDVFLDRARKAPQQQAMPDWNKPIDMVADNRTYFDVTGWFYCEVPADGWAEFASFYQLPGQLTPEGQFRNVDRYSVYPFSAVAAVDRRDQLPGTITDWAAATQIGGLLNQQQWYTDPRHPYWTLVTVKDKQYGDTGQTVTVIERRPGLQLPADFDEWYQAVVRAAGANIDERESSDYRSDGSTFS